MTADVLVVGAGLAGLTAADAMNAAGLSVTVIEARPFVGGRMMTVIPEGLGDQAWFDAGATWHWTDQPRVQALARDLGVGVFAQFRDGLALVEEDAAPASAVDIPPPTPAERRFVGGSQGVCEALADRLAPGAVMLGSSVVAVEHAGGTMTVSAADAEGRAVDLSAEFVVVAVPPRLVLDEIAFTPDLPDELTDVIRGTSTWMATALKCVAVYETAFWREAGRSGLVLSRAGPLREVHDACNADATVAGLWGFVSPSHTYRDLGFDDRREQVFAHLSRLFGPEAADPLRYFERDWSGDPLTNDEVVWVRPPRAYGHPLFARPLCDGRLVWAGTETVADGGGHMEGAVHSGARAASLVLHAVGVTG